MSDTESVVKGVTVKAMNAATWDRAGRRADARDESMATWLARAINTQADIEERDGILPLAQAREALVLDPGTAAQMAHAVHDITAAAVAAGAKPNKGVVLEARRALARTLRTLNGKAPVPQPRPKRAMLPAPEAVP